MSETLNDAIAEAKRAAGLDPSGKYPVRMYADHVDRRWISEFWERVLSIVTTQDPLLHDFLPVAGHPDDDECTYRADGTDDTYCGEPESAHAAPALPDTKENRDE